MEWNGMKYNVIQMGAKFKCTSKLVSSIINF